jgi:predicted Zn finger-like uncharacterized protein
MTEINIICPHCGFSKKIDFSAIPSNATRAKCPNCGRSFPWNRPETAGAEKKPEPGPAVVGVGAATEWGRRPAARTLRFDFTGSATEYFGIWIVNTLLKIVTLGFYSAWAKVRQRRYLCGNITLDGMPFDYLADPRVLFKGWLIGALLFILYTMGYQFLPFLGSSLGLLFLLAMPWLVVRSRIYNLRNLSHRNIRFNFKPNYEEAYLVFAGLTLLTPLTLGILFPYVAYRQKKFLVENMMYGNTPFTFEADPKQFYFIYLKALAGVLVAAAIAITVVAALVANSSPELLNIFHAGKPNREAFLRAMVVFVAGFFIFSLIMYLVGSIYVNTSIMNLVWNSSRIGEERFESSLRVRDMAWIYLTNAVAIPLSFGLLAPWGAIRIARYRYRHMAVIAGAEEIFTASQLEEAGPAGEEIGDIFGIDVAL